MGGRTGKQRVGGGSLKPVLLVTHGSFNPVHAGHVQMMVRAREALESVGRRVVGGEMAITNQHRIQGKGSAAMGDEMRLALLRLALQPHASWLTAADGTQQHSAGRVIADHQARYDVAHGEAVEAWSVEGSDIVIRYPPKAKRPGAARVVVAREGDEAAAAAGLRRAGYVMGRDALLLGATAEAGCISSTAARRALAHKDADALRRCCGDAVAARLLALPAAQVYAWRPAGGEAGWAVEVMDVHGGAVDEESGAADEGGAAGGGGGGGGGGGADDMECVGEKTRGERERDAELRSQAINLDDEPEPLTVPPAVSMTAAGLREIWQATYGARVQGFYSDRPKAGELRALSNFYTHDPYLYTIPAYCGAVALAAAGRPSQVELPFCWLGLGVTVRANPNPNPDLNPNPNPNPNQVELPFAEKGIMLCKAATMGDYAAYDRILRAALPAEAKSLGRGVQPWDQARWDAVVCGVGASVVRAKFAGVPGLAKLLRATGDTLLAEATRNDQVWGVGIDLGDPALANPRRWRGTNVLGWSLMEARSLLGGAGVPGAAAVTGDVGRGRGKAVPRDGDAPPLKPKRQKS